MYLFDKEALPELFETITESTLKAVEKTEILGDDSWLEPIPFGKIAKFFVKKIVAIGDSDKALKKAVGVASISTFIEALKKYNINPVVKDVFLQESIPAIKQNIVKSTFNAKEFDINQFNNNEIVSLFRKELFAVIVEIPEHLQKKLSRYMKEYTRYNFLKLLEDNSAVYEKLGKLYSSGSYEDFVLRKNKELYRSKLKNQFHDIIMNDSESMTLADIYIEPEYAISKNCFIENDPRLQKEYTATDKGFHSINNESIHEFTYKFIESKCNYSLRAKDAKILFLLGYPGQGKSSFCKKLLEDSIEGKRATDKSIYFAKFRNITNVNELINAPLRAIEAHLKDNLEYGLSKDEFGNSLLILDGLDELSMSENFQNNTIDEFCRLLMTDIENKPNLKIIITSRYGYVNIEKLKQENQFLLQLKEFDIEKQKLWLKRYTAFHSETKLTSKKLSDIHKSSTSIYLKELIGQPILLHLIATLNEEIDVNVNRAKIYDNLFEQLVKRSWDTTGQISNLAGIDASDLRELIRNIAFEIYKSGKEYIHKSTVSSLPATKEFIEKLNSSSFQEILKRIMIAFYFQETKKSAGDDNKEDRSDYAIEFLHKTLQEYSVAEKIWHSIKIFSDKNERTNKFSINSDDEALTECAKLFSVRMVTQEIREYIKEIILNDNETDKKTLCERMEKFLPFMLEKQFYTTTTGTPKQVINSCLSNFYGYWFILSQLNQKRNLIPSIQKDNFATLLRLFSGKPLEMDLSYQNLSGINLYGVNFSYSILFNSIFSHCDLRFSHFDYLDNVDFSHADLYRTVISSDNKHIDVLNKARVIESNFLGTNLNCAAMIDVEMVGNFFAGTSMNGIFFYNCFLGNQEFENCNLLNSIFAGCIVNLDNLRVQNSLQNVLVNGKVLDKQ